MSRSGYFWLISSRKVFESSVNRWSAICGKLGGSAASDSTVVCGPRELLVVERDRAVHVQHRDQALVEAALTDRPIGASLRLGGEGVERLAGNALHRGDRVGAHTLVRLRMDLLQVGIVRTHREEALLRQRHHLGATGHDEILHARHHGMSRVVRRRDARSAEAVEGGAAGGHVVAGVERGHPTEVATLLAHLRTGAPHHVVDVGGVEPVALDERGEHRRGEVLRMQVRQGALAGLADAAWRTAGIDDQCVGHGVPPESGRVRCQRSRRSPSGIVSGARPTQAWAEQCGDLLLARGDDRRRRRHRR